MTVLRLACQEKLVAGESAEARIAVLAELGVDAVELRGKPILANGPKTSSKTLSDFGMSASAICMGYRGALLNPEPGSRRQAVDDIRTLLDAAEELGAAGVVVVLAVDPFTPVAFQPISEEDRQLLTDRALAGLGQLAAHAHGMSAKVLLEARNRYETTIVRRLAEAAAMVSQLEGSGVRVLADTFHMNIEEAGVVEAVAANADSIGYVQLADNNRLLPGMGSLDFVAILEALAGTGYSGYVSLEAWDLGDRQPGLPDLVACLGSLRESIVAVNQKFRPLHGSQQLI